MNKAPLPGIPISYSDGGYVPAPRSGPGIVKLIDRTVARLNYRLSHRGPERNPAAALWIRDLGHIERFWGRAFIFGGYFVE